jgi:hypothetical protein
MIRKREGPYKLLKEMEINDTGTKTLFKQYMI